jgi:hypothetical protein
MSTNEIAAKAQAKAQVANPITGPNIAAVQTKLKGKKPSEVLGITGTTLAQLATGKKTKAALKEEQRIALRDLGRALGPNTYYGKKLAAMLWAVEATT